MHLQHCILKRLLVRNNLISYDFKQQFSNCAKKAWIYILNCYSELSRNGNMPVIYHCDLVLVVCLAKLIQSLSNYNGITSHGNFMIYN